MSDVIDCGQVQCIAVKKCGSSMWGRALRQRVWEPQHLRDVHYVTAIRHPAARLVSAFNYFIQSGTREITDQNPYGPKLPFPDWVEWVLAHRDRDLDHHLHKQMPDIYNQIKSAPRGTRLWIGQLEQITENAPKLSKFVGRNLSISQSNSRDHAPWHTYYDKRLLERVRERYREDMAMWLNLLALDGVWVSSRDKTLSNQLDILFE